MPRRKKLKRKIQKFLTSKKSLQTTPKKRKQMKEDSCNLNSIQIDHQESVINMAENRKDNMTENIRNNMKEKIEKKKLNPQEKGSAENNKVNPITGDPPDIVNLEKEKSFQSNWNGVLPASIRYDKSISDAAKLLAIEIEALTRQCGYCYATNETLSKKTGKSVTTIKRLVKELSDADHLHVEITNRYKRSIFIIDKRTAALFKRQQGNKYKPLKDSDLSNDGSIENGGGSKNGLGVAQKWAGGSPKMGYQYNKSELGSSPSPSSPSYNGISKERQQHCDMKSQKGDELEQQLLKEKKFVRLEAINKDREIALDMIDSELEQQLFEKRISHESVANYKETRYWKELPYAIQTQLAEGIKKRQKQQLLKEKKLKKERAAAIKAEKKEEERLRAERQKREEEHLELGKAFLRFFRLTRDAVIRAVDKKAFESYFKSLFDEEKPMMTRFGADWVMDNFQYILGGRDMIDRFRSTVF